MSNGNAILNDRSIRFVPQEDGRLRWMPCTGEAAEPLGLPAGTLSLLSFRTEAEAAADAAVHAEAAFDATGRRVMTRDYLRRLISAIALPCDACADVYFGGVYWHRRDAGGANWGVDIVSGHGDFDGCRACVAAARADLRRRYSIADEA